MAEGQSSVGGGGMGSPQTLFPTPATGQQDNSFFSQFGGNRNQGGGVKMSFLAPIITSLLGGVIGAVGSKDKKKGFKTGLQSGLGVGAQFLEGRALREEQDRKDTREEEKSRIEKRKLGLDEAQFSEDMRTSNQGYLNSAINRYESALEAGNTDKANVALKQIVRHANRGYEMGFISDERRNHFANITDEKIQERIIASRMQQRTNDVLKLIGDPAANDAEVISQLDTIQQFKESNAWGRITDDDRRQIGAKQKSLERIHSKILSRDALSNFNLYDQLITKPGLLRLDSDTKVFRNRPLESMIAGLEDGHNKDLLQDRYLAVQRSEKQGFHNTNIGIINNGMRFALNPDLKPELTEEYVGYHVALGYTQQQALARSNKIVDAIYKGKKIDLVQFLYDLEAKRTQSTGYQANRTPLTQAQILNQWGLGHMNDVNALDTNLLVPDQALPESEWQRQGSIFFQPPGSREEMATPGYVEDRRRVGQFVYSMIDVHKGRGFEVPRQFIEDYNAYAQTVEGLDPYPIEGERADQDLTRQGGGGGISGIARAVTNPGRDASLDGRTPVPSGSGIARAAGDRSQLLPQPRGKNLRGQPTGGPGQQGGIPALPSLPEGLSETGPPSLFRTAMFGRIAQSIPQGSSPEEARQFVVAQLPAPWNSNEEAINKILQIAAGGQ